MPPRNGRKASLPPVAGGNAKRSVSLKSLEVDYIPQKYLPNLNKHCYTSVDHSLMSRTIMKRYWDYVLQFVPTTIAPNVITLTGFVAGMSSFLVLAYYYFLHDAEFPVWVWWYAAASLFLYQTCDAIDGKQARRTGTCSALGELFDHGCDALLTPFVQINQALALGSGPSVLYFYLIQSSLAFFIAIWDQYTTGILVLGFISAPTEGILLACVNFIISGIFTTRIWDTPVIGPHTIHVPRSLTAYVTNKPVEIRLESIRSLSFAFFQAMWLFTVASNIKHGLTRSLRTGHSQNSLLIFSCIAVLTVMHVCMYFFYPDVHAAYPFMLELSYSILIAYIVSSITTARLCIMPYNVLSTYYLITVSVIGVALVAHLCDPTHTKGFSSAIHRTLGYQITALVILGSALVTHKTIIVFHQMAKALNIKIMSIGKRKKAK